MDNALSSLLQTELDDLFSPMGKERVKTTNSLDINLLPFQRRVMTFGGEGGGGGRGGAGFDEKKIDVCALRGLSKKNAFRTIHC